jgi:hypothetical protein
MEDNPERAVFSFACRKADVFAAGMTMQGIMLSLS